MRRLAIQCCTATGLSPGGSQALGLSVTGRKVTWSIVNRKCRPTRGGRQRPGDNSPHRPRPSTLAWVMTLDGHARTDDCRKDLRYGVLWPPDATEWAWAEIPIPGRMWIMCHTTPARVCPSCIATVMQCGRMAIQCWNAIGPPQGVLNPSEYHFRGRSVTEPW